MKSIPWATLPSGLANRRQQEVERGRKYLILPAVSAQPGAVAVLPQGGPSCTATALVGSRSNSSSLAHCC